MKRLGSLSSFSINLTFSFPDLIIKSSKYLLNSSEFLYAVKFIFKMSPFSKYLELFNITGPDILTWVKRKSPVNSFIFLLFLQSETLIFSKDMPDKSLKL